MQLKPEINDPAGVAIAQSLQRLDLGQIQSVRTGKCFVVGLRGTDKDDALRTVKLACEKLLANSVVEDYSIATPTLQEN